VDPPGADVAFADAGEGPGRGDHLAQGCGRRLQRRATRLLFPFHAEAERRRVVGDLHRGRGGDGDSAARRGLGGGGEEGAGGNQRREGEDQGGLADRDHHVFTTPQSGFHHKPGYGLTTILPSTSPSASALIPSATSLSGSTRTIRGRVPAGAA